MCWPCRNAAGLSSQMSLTVPSTVQTLTDEGVGLFSHSAFRLKVMMLAVWSDAISWSFTAFLVVVLCGQYTQDTTVSYKDLFGLLIVLRICLPVLNTIRTQRPKLTMFPGSSIHKSVLTRPYAVSQLPVRSSALRYSLVDQR